MKLLLFLVLATGAELFAQLPFPAYSPPQQVPNVLNNVTNSGYNVGGVTYYGYSSQTELTVAQNGPVVANDNSYVDYSSEYVVTLKPGFEVSNLGPISVFSANTNRYNRDNDILTFGAMIMSNHPNADVGAYERFEIGLDPGSIYLTSIDNFLNGGTGINPYDPKQIRFEAVVTYTSPTAIWPNLILGVNSVTFNGFYYKDFSVTNNSFTPLNTPYPFRIRMALPWGMVSYTNSNVVDVAVRMYVNGVQTGGVFKNQITIHNTNKKGFLHISSYNKLYADRKAAFLGIGQGIGYAEEPVEYGYNHASFTKQRGYISDLAAKGGNFLRLRMDPWSNGVEWEEAGVYGSKRTHNDVAQRPENFDRQFHAWELDKTLELCEALDINMMLCLEQDQVLSDYDPYSHNQNYKYLWPSAQHNDAPRHPYAGLPGVNGTIKNVFTDQQAREYFKQRLFYINARFGYSPAVGMYQLINEIDNIGVYGKQSNGNNATLYHDDPFMQAAVSNWHCEMASYLKNSYPYHITMTGYGAGPDLFDNSPACMDVDTRNDYNNKRDQNIAGRSILITPQSNKPFVFGEIGSGCATIDKCSDIAFHNAVWSNAFKGHLTNGLYWNDWKEENSISHRSNFIFMNAFFSTVDFQNTEWYPGRETDRTNSNGKELYSFFMTDKDKKSENAIGFAHNFDYEPATNGCSISDIGCGNTNIGGANIYSANSLDPQVLVGQLKPFTDYDVEIFDAHNGTVLPPITNKNTGFDTKLGFRVNLGWQDNNGVAPSIVYRVKPSNCSGCRKAGQSEDFTFDYQYPVNDTFELVMPDDMGFENITWTTGNSVMKNKTVVQYSFPKAGKYTIYTKFNDIDQKQYFVTNNVTIVDNTPHTEGIKVFPNPTNGAINIYYGEIKGEVKTIVVYDASGKIILTDNETEKVNITAFSSGLYFLRIIQNDGTTNTYRIVKD